MANPLYDGSSGNPQTQAELAEKSKAAAASLEKDLREVLELQAGRRVLAALLKDTHLDDDAFTGEFPTTARNLGAQSVGRAWRNRIRTYGVDLWRLIENEILKEQ